MALIHYFSGMRRIWIVLTYVLSQFVADAHAQISLGLGGQMDVPLLYNKNVGNYNHSLAAFGPRLSFKYVPQNSTFFPSFSFNSTGMLLPLEKVNDLVVNMYFTQLNAVLWANLKNEINEKAQLYYGLGIGASYFSGKRTELAGNDDLVTSFTNTEPYIKAWAPSFNLQLEYIFPISSEKPLYAGIGGKVQYVHFFDNDIKYNMTITSQNQGAIQLEPELLGNMLNPGVYLIVYYQFRTSNKY
jgi:hypothetical protein